MSDDNSEINDLPRERYGHGQGLDVNAIVVALPEDKVLLVGGDVKLTPLMIALIERGVLEQGEIFKKPQGSYRRP
jgi:hypothetical protein